MADNLQTFSNLPPQKKKKKKKNPIPIPVKSVSMGQIYNASALDHKWLGAEHGTSHYLSQR